MKYFLILAMASVQGLAAEPTKVSCGDHWFKVTTELYFESRDAISVLSGDSGPTPSRRTGTIVMETECPELRCMRIDFEATKATLWLQQLSDSSWQGQMRMDAQGSVLPLGNCR